MAKVELERLSGKWVGEVSTRLDRSPATRKYGLLAPLCWPLWPRFGARRDFPDSLSRRVILCSSASEVATRRTKIRHLAHMLGSSSVLQSDQSLSRAPFESSPSKEQPGFSLP